MAKELWTLRKLNLKDEVVEQLSNESTKIYHSKYWNIIGLTLFPTSTIILILNDYFKSFHLGTVLMIVLIIILGFGFVISARQLLTGTPALELSTESLEIKGTRYKWGEISRIKFLSSMEGTNPKLQLTANNGTEHELALGYLSKLPKDIHTLICKYYSIAMSDI